MQDSEKWAAELPADGDNLRTLATSSTARKAAEEQVFSLRERASAVAALGAARDRLERFVFKLVAKYSTTSDSTYLHTRFLPRPTRLRATPPTLHVPDSTGLNLLLTTMGPFEDYQ